MQPQKTNADPFEFDHFHTLILCLCLNLEVPVNAKDPSPLLLLVQLGASWLRTCVSYISNTLQHISGSSSVAFMSETGEGQILPPPLFFFLPIILGRTSRSCLNTCFLFIWKHTCSFKVLLQKRCIFEMLVFTESCDGSLTEIQVKMLLLVFFLGGGLLAKSTPCLSGQSNLSLVVPSNQGQTAAQHLINK